MRCVLWEEGGCCTSFLPPCSSMLFSMCSCFVLLGQSLPASMSMPDLQIEQLSLRALPAFSTAAFRLPPALHLPLVSSEQSRRVVGECMAAVVKEFDSRWSDAGKIGGGTGRRSACHFKCWSFFPYSHHHCSYIHVQMHAPPKSQYPTTYDVSIGPLPSSLLHHHRHHRHHRCTCAVVAAPS